MENQDNQEKLNVGEWVLAKNNQFIVFNKPSGISAHPDLTEEKSLMDLAEIYTKSKLYPVHRIDKVVSGIVIFAKTKVAMLSLHTQFRERIVKKTYLAVVQNKPELATQRLVHYILPKSDKNVSRVAAKPFAHALEAVLTYEQIAASDKYYLLKINLETGRHHQIRAQLSHIGMPIKGDVKYGARRSNKDRSIHLHAWKIEFKHPVTNEKVEINAPLPDDSLWAYFGEKI
jgi:23S rRNA pseudouridine1911/1915/1917 synthase